MSLETRVKALEDADRQTAAERWNEEHYPLPADDVLRERLHACQRVREAYENGTSLTLLDLDDEAHLRAVSAELQAIFPLMRPNYRVQDRFEALAQEEGLDLHFLRKFAHYVETIHNHYALIAWLDALREGSKTEAEVEEAVRQHGCTRLWDRGPKPLDYSIEWHINGNVRGWNEVTARFRQDENGNEPPFVLLAFAVVNAWAGGEGDEELCRLTLA